MKQYFLFIFVFISYELHAQYFNYGPSSYESLDKYTVVDSANIKCIYTLTYIKDTLKLKEKSIDKQILLIGKNTSKYYSQYVLDYNQFIKNLIKKGAQNVPNISEAGAWSYELFKNYPKGKETVTDITSMLQSNYIYEEELSVFNWQITAEKKTILSYNCQKATVSFRGRDYIAWFTSDIPVNNGPWKFGGLPGLILKLQDSKNNFIFECDGLEKLTQKEPIRFYQVNYTKISRRDLAKIYQRFHDDMAAYLKQIGITTREVDRKTQKSKQVEHSSYKIPYNPIELE